MTKGNAADSETDLENALGRILPALGEFQTSQNPGPAAKRSQWLPIFDEALPARGIGTRAVVGILKDGDRRIDEAVLIVRESLCHSPISFARVPFLQTLGQRRGQLLRQPSACQPPCLALPPLR